MATPLHLAVGHGKTQPLCGAEHFQLPCRALPCALQNGDTPLQLAICGGGYDQRGKLDCMELLISHGANVELPNRVRLALPEADKLPKGQA